MAASSYVFSELPPAGPTRARSGAGAPAGGRHRPAAACWAAAAGLALPLLLSPPAVASAPGEEGGALVRRAADAPVGSLVLRPAAPPAGAAAVVSLPGLPFAALPFAVMRAAAPPPPLGLSPADPSPAGADTAAPAAPDADTAAPADAEPQTGDEPQAGDGPSAEVPSADPQPPDTPAPPDTEESPSAEPSAGAGGSDTGVPAPGPSPVPTTRTPSAPGSPGAGRPGAGPGPGHQAGPSPTAEPSPAEPRPEGDVLPSPAVQGPVAPSSPSSSPPSVPSVPSVAPFADPAGPGRDARHPVPDRLLPADRAQAYRHHFGPASPGPGGRFRVEPPAAGGTVDEDVAPAPPDAGTAGGSPQALAAGPDAVEVAGPVAAPTRWTDSSTLQLPLGAGLALIGSGLALVGLRMRRG
ncbi:hypothetical protein GCM10010495_09670 [Kitasatospora herbaricolor]|uniref:hypothetical protein n=1 Tax=Kitasatospora herbaricolor TaxID=68217 RepID=UPI00174A14AB|nr:hypothetical protein [Kitasatospora herbaricolor]MDQ0309597.1 hypothetical protein [Kitasatospora herbaricolor]GGV00807.1 hypothetical protein GCM10010495_09670 [Kitasatospora herbaricolor]